MLPQAFVAMLPPSGNLLIEPLKGTSLVSLITIRELAFTGKLLLTAQWRPAEIYPLMLVIYFVMSFITREGPLQGGSSTPGRPTTP